MFRGEAWAGLCVDQQLVKGLEFFQLARIQTDVDDRCAAGTTTDIGLASVVVSMARDLMNMTSSGVWVIVYDVAGN
jgi:hypothetical protein